MKKTKIICTVGPSTDKPGVLENLLLAGMNVARFNFSHGSHEEHARRIAMVREAARATKLAVAIMLDNKGPEMRLGKFEGGKTILSQGQTFTLTTRDIVGNNSVAAVNHPHFHEEIAPGDMILLSDGLISLKVEAVSGQDITTTVQNSGLISDRKRVAAPGVYVKLPLLAEQDVADIQFGIKQGIDFIAASFVQRAGDILAIRKLLEEAGVQNDIDIIAKIENAEGVKRIDEILKVTDGVMVARGDLGVEIPVEEVPLVQKMIIEKCNKAGKPVITATQMLESMLTNPRPTRAEASDVANAILDGSDAIMLSGETASGQYPVEAVQTMAKLAVRIEASLPYDRMLLAKGIGQEKTTTEAISHASVQVAHGLGAAAILAATHTGHAARMVSKYRPKSAIIAVTPRENTLRRSLLYWGVYPVLAPDATSTDEMTANAIGSALAADAVKEGDLVVVTAGVPSGTSGTTNMIRVHVVGNILLKGTGIGRLAATGKLCIARSVKELKAKFQKGDVLVLKAVDEETAVYAAQAGAIIAEEGGLTSHAAVVGISFGIPVIVGADGATERLTDGMTVTVDPKQGIVYQGKINAR
ncbi:pyruvate kinase [Sporomusa sp. GT1]|uniref:pyruvate kinase n=1 Tax=Sporomusa sp. GT1 TaxID=1534747 RepID=UPI00166BDC34|nr:pyruvate kinase [Sporomusa sp. GT1]